MSQRLARVALLTFAICSLGALAGGCGGGGRSGPALTLDEYFNKLSAANSTAKARFEQVGKQLSTNQPEAEALKTIQEVYPEEVATLKDLLRSTERLRPPAEVKAEHDAAVNALRDSLAVEEKNETTIANATTFQQVLDLLNSQAASAVSKKASDTCLALEQAGTERGMHVDLDC
jgi:hypothetical protein